LDATVEESQGLDPRLEKSKAGEKSPEERYVYGERLTKISRFSAN
jgi:hypothetical protein